MTLTEMREILKARDLQLTKSLGQNFLHDANQLRRIVAAAELSATDRVFEIGPGLGPLTELLLASGATVLAIEKDSRLSTFLRERYANEPRLTLRHDDALAYLQRRENDSRSPIELGGDVTPPPPSPPWKLVANLPYSVASPILVELALHPHGPERMVVTLQLEVAQRIVAARDTDSYGLLTLLISLHYEPGNLFKIPAACFFPAPDVESACITLTRRTRPPLDAVQTKLFVRIVKRAFSQRRKMMLKLLKSEWPEDKLHACFARLGISPQERAEKVSLEVFTELCRLLSE